MKPISEVHIVLLWQDQDRILEPIDEYRPNRVYVLYHEDPAMETASHTELQSTVEDLGTTVETCPVDLFDMYDVMGAVTTIADSHTDDTVRVNVNSGTQQSAIGATMACMDEGTKATPYVVDVAGEEASTEPVPDSANGGATELTIYQIDSPSRDQVAALAIIEAHDTQAKSAKKRTLIDEGMEYGFEFLEGKTEPDKGDYNKLKSRITAPLDARGYISIEQHGTRHYMTLTDAGKQTLRAFRHRAETVIQDLESRTVTANGDSAIDFNLDNPVADLHSIPDADAS